MMQAGSSFRDPDASVTIGDDRVIRSVRRESAEPFARMLDDPCIQSLVASGKLIGTRPVETEQPVSPESADAPIRYEHDLIPFVSYPVEWSPAMLAKAAEFTLSLGLELLEQGYQLKDAAPGNVVFDATTPILVDVPSIVPRPEGTYLWQAQDQFERTMLLPLVAYVEAGLPIAWSLQDPARGIAHECLDRMLGAKKWVRPMLLKSVTLPAALTRRAGAASHGIPAPMKNDSQARFVFERSLQKNLKLVRRLSRAIDNRSESMWQQYTRTRDHYADSDISAKREFVRQALERVGPRWVLDVGANTGEFSQIAAARSRVVALDSDEAAVNRIFAESDAAKADVFAMVGDIARPTPAFGWQNQETASFIDRACGRFDLVMMLAVIHHMRATSGIPATKILDLARDLTNSHAIVEHVPLSDPMFQRLSRGRDALYGDIDKAEFERALMERFTVEQSELLANGRTLYLLKRR